MYIMCYRIADYRTLATVSKKDFNCTNDRFNLLLTYITKEVLLMYIYKFLDH